MRNQASHRCFPRYVNVTDPDSKVVKGLRGWMQGYPGGLLGRGGRRTAALFQLLLSIAPSGTVFSAAPTTIPTFTLRGWLEA